jgi:hypothetical protein
LLRDVFRAAAFELDLAPGWWCEPDGTAHVCSPPGKPPYAATVIMAMKERNEEDNLKSYEEYLKQPKKISSSSGAESEFSKVRYVRISTIGEHQWVEAQHSGSELPNYDTYYLATNTSYLGIVVTMSVHKDYSKQYVDGLKDMIATLHIYQR